MVRHLDAKVDGLSSRLKEAEHDLSDDSPILRKDRLSDFAAVKVESRSQEVAAKVSAAVSACGPCGVCRVVVGPVSARCLRLHPQLGRCHCGDPWPHLP